MPSAKKIMRDDPAFAPPAPPEPPTYFKVQTEDVSDATRVYRNVTYVIIEVAGVALMVMSKDGEDTVVPLSTLKRWRVRAEKKQ